jgi:hypothetical protein
VFRIGKWTHPRPASESRSFHTLKLRVVVIPLSGLVNIVFFSVASSLCFLSAFVVWFLPRIDQDTIEKEDRLFRAYLIKNNFDISQIGDQERQDKRRASIEDGVQA